MARGSTKKKVKAASKAKAPRRAKLQASPDRVLGIDIGGTGIKGAVVNIKSGELLSDRVRIPTPKNSTPKAVLAVIERVQQELRWSGAVGLGFPGIIKKGEVTRAPNLDDSWIGFPIESALKKALGCSRLAVGNDADAAGLAEVAFGAGRKAKGTCVLVTLGTGIGTAVFLNGALLPFTELGHLRIKGRDAERFASNSAREENEWSWKKWGRYVDHYLSHLEYLLGVDLFIIGGGVSKKSSKFFRYFESVNCPVVPAEMGNLAGIVGAAMFAPKAKRVTRRR